MIDEKLLIETMQWKMREAGTSDWNRCLDEVERFIKEFPHYSVQSATQEIAKAEVEWNYPMDYAVAIDEAIEAVDKQIPEKPEIKDEYYVCPICGVYQETSEGNPPYCINCGQRLLWEAEE